MRCAAFIVAPLSSRACLFASACTGTHRSSVVVKSVRGQAAKTGADALQRPESRAERVRAAFAPCAAFAPFGETRNIHLLAVTGSQPFAALPASQEDPRGSIEVLMVTKLAKDDSGRSQLVEAFAQLSGLPVYTCQMRSPHTQSVSKMVSRLHSRARTLSPPRHPGLRLLIPDSRDLASSEGFTAPDAGLLRLLPIVGTPFAYNSLGSE